MRAALGALSVVPESRSAYGRWPHRKGRGRVLRLWWLCVGDI